MKILMVNKFLYPKGGAETYFLKIGNYLKQQGHEVQYFGMYDEKNTVGNELNLYTKNVDFHNAGIEKFLYPFKIIYSLEAKRKIKKIIKHFKPDIIHLNNINFQLTPSIIDAGYEMNIPVIQTVHDLQMLCPNHMLFNQQTNQICEKCIHGSKWNCMKNCCIHGSKAKSFIGTLEGILYQHKKTYEKVSMYICPSYFLEKKLLTDKRFQGKTRVLHNFIEIESVTKKVKKEDYVLYFGRLSEEKGFQFFINACKKLPQIKFKVAGTGPLEHLCTGVENVEYVGFQFGESLNQLIAKAKFTVYPSIWYENCPLSVLESISLGTPVITIKHGGVVELVKEQVTGRYIDIKEINHLDKAIENLYQDEKQLKEMYDNCFKEAKNMISIEQYYEELMNEYQQICSKKK